MENSEALVPLARGALVAVLLELGEDSTLLYGRVENQEGDYVAVRLANRMLVSAERRVVHLCRKERAQ